MLRTVGNYLKQNTSAFQFQNDTAPSCHNFMGNILYVKICKGGHWAWSNSILNHLL